MADESINKFKQIVESKLTPQNSSIPKWKQALIELANNYLEAAKEHELELENSLTNADDKDLIAMFRDDAKDILKFANQFRDDAKDILKFANQFSDDADFWDVLANIPPLDTNVTDDIHSALEELEDEYADQIDMDDEDED